MTEITVKSFTQNSYGDHNTAVRSSGHMKLTANHENRPGGGDTFSFGGTIGAVGSIGGSNNQNTINAGAGGGTAANTPKATGI